MNPEGSCPSPVRPAPSWAEARHPRHPLVRDIPALLVIRLPGEGAWQVVTGVEADAIADPASLLGGVLRAHCGLLSLPYFSAN